MHFRVPKRHADASTAVCDCGTRLATRRATFRLVVATLLVAVAPTVASRAEDVPIRRYDSPRLTIYSDLPPEKLRLMDEAVEAILPEWLAYFGPPPDVSTPAARQRWLSQWKITGYVMADAARFRKQGLLPPSIPDFPHGISSGASFWMHEQDEDYFRRHLLLHEATHCYLRSIGHRGPVWYEEGIAETFATHRHVDGEWNFRTVPASKDEAPGWGRVPLLRNAVEAGAALSVEDVCRMPADRFLSLDQYAWCWALATFLEQHPRYHERFRRYSRMPIPTPAGLRDASPGDAAAAQLRDLFRGDLAALSEEWTLFAAQFDYGYEVPATVLDFAPGRPLATGRTQNVKIAARAGWQNTQVRIEPGRKYEVIARGRFTLGDRPKPWTSEPAGISLRYVGGQPIGRLLAAIRSEELPDAPANSGFGQEFALGARGVIEHATTGTLYLRLNDAWGELSNNRGHVEVTIRAGE